MLQLARFIVKENSCHHRAILYSEQQFTSEINSVYKEDLSLFNSSVYYVATSDSSIVGSVKITLWDKINVLPIQKLFKIKLENIPHMNDNTLVWHVGRLAISRSGHTEGAALLKKLLTLAIYSICKHDNGIMVAECDRKLLRGLNMMGIKTETLAPSIEYLGSETIAVYATDEWLSAFLNKNEYVQSISAIANKSRFTQAHNSVQQLVA